MATSTQVKQLSFSNGSIVNFENDSLGKLISKLSQTGVNLSVQEVINHIETQCQGITSGHNITVGFNWLNAELDYQLYTDIFYIGKSSETKEILPFKDENSTRFNPVAIQYNKVSVYNFAY